MYAVSECLLVNLLTLRGSAISVVHGFLVLPTPSQKTLIRFRRISELVLKNSAVSRHSTPPAPHATGSPWRRPFPWDFCFDLPNPLRKLILLLHGQCESSIRITTKTDTGFTRRAKIIYIIYIIYIYIVYYLHYTAYNGSYNVYLNDTRIS